MYIIKSRRSTKFRTLREIRCRHHTILLCIGIVLASRDNSNKHIYVQKWGVFFVSRAHLPFVLSLITTLSHCSYTIYTRCYYYYYYYYYCVMYGRRHPRRSRRPSWRHRHSICVYIRL